MDSATWCPTPAAVSAASRLRPEVRKNSSTALSSNEGELVRSITTCAPAMASFSPAPVMVLTPVLDEAATTSWPRPRRMATVFEPIRPLPPITTIFMIALRWTGIFSPTYHALQDVGELQAAIKSKTKHSHSPANRVKRELRLRLIRKLC